MIVLAAAGVGDRFADTVTSGSFVAALGVAVVAGLVSFGSPCMLPLVPGYLSYVAGLSGADVTARENGETGRRGRVLAGAALFVAGFTAVFVSYGAAFGNLGAVLVQHQRAVEGVLGAATVLFGLAFLGLGPAAAAGGPDPAAAVGGAERRAAAGVVFGVGWTPCVGPTLGAVQTLAFSAASAGRGAVLSAGYCAGLGLPFLIAALGLRRGMGVLAFLRRNSRWLTRIGGAAMVAVGVLLATGVWDVLMIHLRVAFSGFSTVI